MALVCQAIVITQEYPMADNMGFGVRPLRPEICFVQNYNWSHKQNQVILRGV